jgi:hypothetical protein
MIIGMLGIVTLLSEFIRAYNNVSVDIPNKHERHQQKSHHKGYFKSPFEKGRDI